MPGRPTLIILDEIDGAMGGTEGAGAINELIKLAAGKKPADGKEGQVPQPCTVLRTHALPTLNCAGQLSGQSFAQLLTHCCAA